MLLKIITAPETNAGTTRDDVEQLATETNITIASDDWDRIGEVFSSQLNSLDKASKAVFPANCTFWFLCYQFGK